ncbi:caspase family protein [Aquimarina sp. 2201CG5-10]|uniref:caspase family protein n=1 Tax=Aquimarina callyspongiae TaxID=3098150 RepID=UPI002AB35442|nr:caspase family protein [Aquimarina sp. 2201CG5-10]MDY8134860.1 caspase family protein [Aquimarina sp. 2201CG5-10]
MCKQLLFFVLLCTQITTTFSQKDSIVIQKPNYSSILGPPFGIHFKLSGDKTKIAFLVDKNIEIWDVSSRRILFKKEIGNTDHLFGLNHSGDVFYVFKKNPKANNLNTKENLCVFYDIYQKEPILKLKLDIIDVIKFDKSGLRFGVIKNGKIINQTIDFYRKEKNRYYLEHTLKKPVRNLNSYIFDLEFTSDKKKFNLFITEDATKDSPVIFQEWRLENYSHLRSKKSNGFNYNSVLKNLINDVANINEFIPSNRNLNQKMLVKNINSNYKNYIELFDFKSGMTRTSFNNNIGFLKVEIINEKLIATINTDYSISIWNIDSENLISRMDPIEVPTSQTNSKTIQTLKISSIAVNENQNEVYFSIKGRGKLRVWNYKYGRQEIFNTKILPVMLPFFTSDSTIVYKKGKHIEHYNFKKLKVIDKIKERNDGTRNFDFKYDINSGIGAIKVRDQLKILSVNPLKIIDSISLKTLRPYPLSDPIVVSDKLEHIAIIENPNLSLKESATLNNEGNLDVTKIRKLSLIPPSSQKIKKLYENRIASKIKLYQHNRKKIIPKGEIEIPKYAISDVSFSEDNQNMVINSYNIKNFYPAVDVKWSTYLYNINFKSLKEVLNRVNGSSSFSPFSKLLCSINETINYYIIEIRNYNDLATINELKIDTTHKVNKKRIELSQELKFLNESMILFYGKEKNLLINLKSGKQTFLDLGFEHFDIKHSDSLIVSSNTGLQFYSKNLKKIFSKYFHKDMTSSLIIDNNLNYLNKGKGYELVSLFKNNRTYGFEQFDLKYHRPDLVIESIKKTIGDSIYEMKELYELAHKKRLERMGKKEEAFQSDIQAPELTITNKARLPYKTDNPVVNIDIKAADRKYHLNKLQISVNGTLIRNPDYKLQQKTISKTIPLPLSNGTNKILISVINDQGVSSDLEEIQMEYAGQPIVSRLYIVSLGVSAYQHLKTTPNSSRDAIRLGKAFKQINTKQVYSLSLTDQQVTKNNLKQVSEFLSQTRENDVILFFASGHAIQIKGEYFFCTGSSNIDNITTTGITYNDFDNLLGSTKSRNRLLILNTCYSGEIFNANTIQEMKAIDLMRKVFEDLKVTNGTTVISASEGTDKYYESPNTGNGIITLAILDLINSKQEITAQEFCKEIITYCTRKSNEDPFETKTNKNIPLIRHNNIDNNFRMW